MTIAMRNDEILLNEMVNLAIGLNTRNIPFTARALYGGMQIICDTWDAICHDGSYGHEQGLIEVMGLGVDDEEDVVGFLTAAEVLEMVDKS
jgi:hypothetical protein